MESLPVLNHDQVKPTMLGTTNATVGYGLWLSETGNVGSYKCFSVLDHGEVKPTTTLLTPLAAFH